MKKVLGLIFAASVVLAAPLAHAKEAVPAAKRVEQPAPVSVTLSAWSVTLDKAGKEIQARRIRRQARRRHRIPRRAAQRLPAPR